MYITDLAESPDLGIYPTGNLIIDIILAAIAIGIIVLMDKILKEKLQGYKTEKKI